MAEKSKKPAIRFAGFTDAWEQRKLCKITNYRNGKGHEENQSDTGSYELINLNSISIDGGLKTSGKFIEDGTDTLLENDLVMVLSDVGHGDLLGRVAIIPENNRYVLNQRVALLRIMDNTNPYFLFSIINGNQVYFKKEGAGSSQLNISKYSVENFVVDYPQIVEQRKIANYLSNLDNLITLHQRKYDKLVNVKKAMLEKMFPKDGADVPEIRFKGFTEAWEQRKLGNLASFSKGYGYSKSDLMESGTPIILYGRLYTNYETVISDVDTYANEKKGSVYSRGGEVIVPASGETAEDISVASVVEKQGVLLGGDLNIINPVRILNSVFLAISISNGNPHKEMAKMAQGKSVVHLHNADLEKINLNFPSCDEQALISTYFQNIDNLITLHQRKLEKLKNLKKACLEKMFV